MHVYKVQNECERVCVCVCVCVCMRVSVLVYMCSMKERKMGHQKKFDLKVIFYKDALNTKKLRFILHFVYTLTVALCCFYLTTDAAFCFLELSIETYDGVRLRKLFLKIINSFVINSS